MTSLQLALTTATITTLRVKTWNSERENFPYVIWNNIQNARARSWRATAILKHNITERCAAAVVLFRIETTVTYSLHQMWIRRSKWSRFLSSVIRSATSEKKQKDNEIIRSESDNQYRLFHFQSRNISRLRVWRHWLKRKLHYYSVRYIKQQHNGQQLQPGRPTSGRYWCRRPAIWEFVPRSTANLRRHRPWVCRSTFQFEYIVVGYYTHRK
jgi:hypothetical protein